MSYPLRVVLLLFILISTSVGAENVQLSGSAPEFANQELVFKTFTDQITYTEVLLAKCPVDSAGNFACSLSIDQTRYVFLRLGAYEAFLFIEPEMEYQIILPERKDKTMADELNPYFEPIQYHLGIINTHEKELNYQLAFFDEIYALMLNNSLHLTYNKLKKHNANTGTTKVDTVYSDKTYSRIVDNSAYLISQNFKEIDIDREIEKADSIFADVDIKFFNDFKKYKYAQYRHLSNQEMMKSISNSYYQNNEILYHNPAYMSLFNLVYKDYFQYFGRTEKGGKIYQDINKQESYSALNNTLQQDSILANDTLRELVILKCLYDEFYKDKFSRKAMLKILDSLSLSTQNPEHLLIAKNIRNKVTKLLTGYEPPQFQLFDKDSNLVSLNDFKGKYVYLGFCTTVSYACIKEFEMLRSLYERHQKNFEIVVICMDENLPQMKHFVERKRFPYTFLHYGNQVEVFKDYDIRAFPTYYFINKQGKLSLSPAASPDENVELQIFKVMRANGDL